MREQKRDKPETGEKIALVDAALRHQIDDREADEAVLEKRTPRRRNGKR